MSKTEDPFKAETSQKLLRLADDLPTVWEIFRQRGTGLFDLYVSHIEQMRERPADEHPYTYCFLEQFKEALGQRYRVWLPSKRHEYKDSLYRSSYLDHLQAKKEAGDPSYPRDNPGNHIDANFAHYTRLKLRDSSRWLGFIAKYREQLRMEAQFMMEPINALSAKPHKPTVTRMGRLLEDLLHPIGFETVLRGVKHKRPVFRKLIGKDVALYVEMYDFSPGRGGYLAYIFQPPEYPLWEDIGARPSPAPLILSPGQWLPGAQWYQHFDDDWNQTVLNALINRNLIEIITERWQGL